MVSIDVATFRRWADASVVALQVHQQEIDDLNVFPVPDGDTGTNLLLTMRSAVQLVADEGAQELAATAATLARGALLGARGNSGVILSQFLRGFAEALPGATDPAGGPARLADAFSRAQLHCYAAVTEPVEGTILTVARAAATAAAGGAESGQTIAGVARGAAAAAAVALRATPLQLPALARAGVVDAGGRGLCVLLDALVAVLTGEPLATSAPATAHSTVALERARETGSAEFCYEVQYLLDADEGAIEALTSALGGLGDSLLVVGSGDGVWNVHVHVNDVGAAIEAGVDAGRPRRISVTRFCDQIEAGRDRAAAQRAGRAVVAVAPGEGLGDLFEAEGVVVVDGGPTNNPSVAEVLAAVQGTGAAEVVLLPNHGNVTGVAAAAAEKARADGQDVAVVPTRSPVQGLAAIAVRDDSRRFTDDVIGMAEAAAATRWAEVTIAVREAMTSAGRCAAGDALGLAEGDVVLIGPSIGPVAVDLVDRLLLSGGEMVTAIFGATATPGLRAELQAHLNRAHPTVERVFYDGGQPHYPLLLGIE